MLNGVRDTRAMEPVNPIHHGERLRQLSSLEPKSQQLRPYRMSENLRS